MAGRGLTRIEVRYLRHDFLTATVLQKLLESRTCSKKSEELARILGEGYSNQLEDTLTIFSNKKEKLYLFKVAKLRKLSAYDAMKQDRVHKFPAEHRVHYCMCKASEEYKNLTAAEYKFYQEMANTMNVGRFIDYEKRLKNMPEPPRKVTPFVVMRKCRKIEIPKWERWEFYLRKGRIEYNNLSASKLSEYTRIAEQINHHKMEVYEKSVEQWKRNKKWLNDANTWYCSNST